MDFDRFNQQLKFIIEIDKAKQVLRNTVVMDATRKENDAEHSWHMAIAALIFSEYCNEKHIDILRVLKMILIHDIIEIDAGDVFVYGNVDWEEKARKELEAARRIFGLLPEDQKNEFMILWNEYEAGTTFESQFAQALDSFMPILHNYKTNGLQWQRLNVTSENVLLRNHRIEKGSIELWDYIKNIVNDAVTKGYLSK